MEKKILLKLKLAVLSAVSAIGLTCGVNMDAWHVSREGLENHTALAFVLDKLNRSLSTEQFRMLLFALLTGFAVSAVQKRSFAKRDRVTAAIFAVLFSGTQLLCRSYKECQSWAEVIGTKFVMLRALIIITGTSIVVYHLILLAFWLLDKISGQGVVQGARMDDSSTAGERPQKAEASAGGRFTPPCASDKKALRKYYVVAALLVFLCWLPYFVLFYPGTSGNDTATQIAQFFGQSTWTRSMSAVRGKNIYLSNHFPYFTTLLAGGFVQIGIWLGDAAYGVALYALLQMLLLAFSLTAVWVKLYQLGLSGRCLKAGLIFTAFFPLYPVHAVCMLKDVAFADFCLILSLFLLEIARTKGEVFRSKRFCLGLAVISLLVMLFRSQGVYVVAAIALVVLVVYRRYWLGTVITMILPVLLFQFIWLGVILPKCNVAPAGKQEMLGFLFQQTARYVTQYPDDVTEEEKEIISNVIDYERLAELYNPGLSDPVKYTYRQDSTSEELSDYMRVWFRMFLRHPGTYVEAVLNNCYGFFYLEQPSGMVYTTYKLKPYWEKDGDLYVEAPFQTERITTTVELAVDFLQRIPGVSLLFSVGAYAWLVLYFTLDVIRKKKYAFLVPGLMPVLSTGILLICPANGNFRYILPLIFTAPLMAGLCLLKRNAASEK